MVRELRGSGKAEHEVFIGTPERGAEPRSSRVRQVHSPSEGQGMPSMPSMPSMPVGMWKFFGASWKSFDQCSVDFDTGWYYVWRDT